MLGKLRPVGNKVPLPVAADDTLPWEHLYCHEFTRSGAEALGLAVGMAIMEFPRIDSPEVLMPAYACPDIVAAIISQGAKPVLVDLESTLTPRMSIEDLLSNITANTIAIIAVGFLGIPERLSVLSKICKESNLFLIEDSAQCFPPESRKDGFADFVVLSFGRGKPVNLMGGGAVLIRKDHHPRCRRFLSQHNVVDLKIGVAWHLKRLIFNLMLSRLCFALLERVPFLRLGETSFQSLNDIKRLTIPKGLVVAGTAQFYRCPMWQVVYGKTLSFLDDLGWIRLHSLLVEHDGAVGPALRYALIAPSRGIRDVMVRRLNCAGIAASCFYGKALLDIEGVAEHLDVIAKYPSADEFSSRLLTLPCHDGMTDQDVSIIFECFRSGLHSISL